MTDRIRRLRWLLVLKLMLLAIALVGLFALSALSAQWASAWVLGGALLWGVPFLGAAWRRERALAALGFLEVLWVSVLVGGGGHGHSPFALLFLPLLAQAALFLSGPLYLWIAGVAWAGFAVAAAKAPQVPPNHLVMVGLAAVAGAFWLLAWLPKREHEKGTLAKRRYHFLLKLLGHLPPESSSINFWDRYVNFVRNRGSFSSVAFLRFELPTWRVVASDRLGAWENLAARQSPFLRHQVLEQCQSELFLEEQEAGRIIVCVPIRHGSGGPALGILCALAASGISLQEAENRLAPWLPLAALVLASNAPHWRLEQRFIDWRQLLDTTLEKLAKRLASHLVLLELEPGVVRADALLLSDAIAHVIEEALNRLPAKSQLRLSARREPGAWHFELASTPALVSDPGAHHPGLMLAKQVIQAHGGAWAPVRHADGLAWGFTLPDALAAPGLPVAQPALRQA
jgi:hypothetical protein